MASEAGHYQDNPVVLKAVAHTIAIWNHSSKYQEYILVEYGQLWECTRYYSATQLWAFTMPLQAFNITLVIIKLL